MEKKRTPEEKKNLEIFNLQKRLISQRKEIGRKDRKINELQAERDELIEQLRKANEALDLAYSLCISEVTG